MNVLTEVIEWRPTVTRCSPTVPEVFRVGPSVIHRRSGRVESPRGEQWLRRIERELLIYLYEHITQTFAREQLLQAVWRCRPGLVTRTVDQTVATLRKKIEFDSDRPRFLQTAYGIGYRLVLQAEKQTRSHESIENKARTKNHRCVPPCTHRGSITMLDAGHHYENHGRILIHHNHCLSRFVGSGQHVARFAGIRLHQPLLCGA